MISYFKSLKHDKTKLAIFLLSIWLIISVVYMGWQLIANSRVNLFWQGYGTAVEDLIERAEDEACEPFPVFMEDRQVYLINVSCLGDDIDFQIPEEGEVEGVEGEEVWTEEEE